VSLFTTIVNKQIAGMIFCVEHHSDPKCHSYLEHAFGPHYDLNKIQENVHKIDGPLPVHKGYKNLPHGTPAETVYDAKTGAVINVEFSPDFPARSERERAGTIIHEKAHVAAQATDIYKVATGDESKPGHFITLTERRKIEKALPTAQENLKGAERAKMDPTKYKAQLDKAQADFDSLKRDQCMEFSIFH
jgi:hypothetical protein